ncbi:MAG: elongation factor P [Candidatus Parcubacteria bacterium]|nr:elongation factor P [Candidatus Parcubacteria bacterium]
MSTLSSLSDIKKGANINWNGEPYIVMDAHFVRMQMRKPVMQTKLKHLITGKILEYSFKPGDKVAEADMSRNKANYQYKDENFAYFMDNNSYEQFQLPLSTIGNRIKFLKDGTDVDVLYYEGNAVSIDMPIKMNFKVTSAPPGIKGDSASNVTKQITLETGAVINAPLFVKEGEIITVNTDTEEYVGRA